MGIKKEISKFFYSLNIYLFLINVVCDINLINCDLQKMKQQTVGLEDSNRNSGSDSTQEETYNNNNNNNNNKTNNNLNINATQLKQFVMDGLDMKNVPDMNLINISQEEYFTKYAEYLSRINHRERILSKYYGDDVTDFVQSDDGDIVKKIFAFKHSNRSKGFERQRQKRSLNEEDLTYLNFELPDKEELPSEIEESTLNIFLTNENLFDMQKVSMETQEDDTSDYNSSLDLTTKLTLKSSHITAREHRKKPNHHHHQKHNNHHNSTDNFDLNRNKIQIITNKQKLRLHIYQTTADSHERVWLFTKDITLPINSDVSYDNSEFTYNKWIQLDVNTAVTQWLSSTEKSLDIEIFCESCSKYGIQIVNNHKHDASHNRLKSSTSNNPTLNLIGNMMQRAKRKTIRRKDKSLDAARDYMSQPKKTICHKNGDKKCCRHKWVIDFRELGGYEYIIQPNRFDAGFCDGSCPFRFNVANNHAYFQSMARHQLKDSTVPDVCCAPTRLVDMEVLHIDENDHTRLKVTTMKKMRVMKCSCT